MEASDYSPDSYTLITERSAVMSFVIIAGIASARRSVTVCEGASPGCSSLGHAGSGSGLREEALCKTPGLDGREARADQSARILSQRTFGRFGRHGQRYGHGSGLVGGLNWDNADERLGRVRAHDTCVLGRSTGLDVEMTPCMALEDLWS